MVTAAPRSELVQIHEIVMDIAGCPAPSDADTYTVRAVKEMALRINRYEGRDEKGGQT